MWPAYHDGVVDGKANVLRGTKPSFTTVAVGVGAEDVLASSAKAALDDTKRRPSGRLAACGSNGRTASLDNDPGGRAGRSIDRSILRMVAVVTCGAE